MAGVKFAIPQRGPPQAQQGLGWDHKRTDITTRASDRRIDDNDAIDAWRDGFAATIERWRDRPGQLDLTLLEHSGAEPPPTLMYQGRHDLTLKSAYADMVAPRLPTFEPPPPRAGG